MIESSGVERTRRPVAELSADALEQELVADFVQGLQTPLVRFLPAILRIAEVRHITAERAYQNIREEALSLGAPRVARPRVGRNMPVLLIHCLYYKPGVNPLNGGDLQDLYLASDVIKQADVEVDTDQRYRIRIRPKDGSADFSIVPAVMNANGTINTDWLIPGVFGQYLIGVWWNGIRDDLGWTG